MTADPAVPLEVAAATAKQLLWESHPGEMLLLDCRTPEEHATARIAGAVLVPMQELPERVAELEPWRTRRIIVHCHHGVRSLRVTHWLRDRGFAQVSSLQGGIDAWSTDVDPSVPRY
ncbi:MAG: rhodanese [Planctomycetia bacterium]|nr:rhodanese [Planctomycetia bacterium]